MAMYFSAILLLDSGISGTADHQTSDKSLGLGLGLVELALSSGDLRTNEGTQRNSAGACSTLYPGFCMLIKAARPFGTGLSHLAAGKARGGKGRDRRMANAVRTVRTSLEQWC
jgi:hypothetical protein